MNDTPRTDALRGKIQPPEATLGEMTDFARQLEREVAALREALRAMVNLWDEWEDAEEGVEFVDEERVLREARAALNPCHAQGTSEG